MTKRMTAAKRSEIVRMATAQLVNIRRDLETASKHVQYCAEEAQKLRELLEQLKEPK